MLPKMLKTKIRKLIFFTAQHYRTLLLFAELPVLGRHQHSSWVSLSGLVEAHVQVYNPAILPGEQIPTMPGVFISYRREDSAAYAGRLFDILSAEFGADNTFMDVDDIKGGDDFTTVIERKLGMSDALVAVIGEHWLTVTEPNGGRRLDNPNDFVRIEIAKALERGIRVIPVLVGGATLPHPSDLPDNLKALCERQAVEDSRHPLP